MASKFEHKQVNPHLEYVRDPGGVAFPVESISGDSTRRCFFGVFRWSVLLILWVMIIVLWMPKVFPKIESFGAMSMLSICVSIFASVFIFYSSYHLTALAFALVRRQSKPLIPSHMKLDIPVAIIMTLRDDFQEPAAETLLAQDYKRFHVYICDDSQDPKNREKIDSFHYKNQAKTTVIRRENNAGFKAGNINHALQTGLITEPLILLVDADERLESNFLRTLLIEFIYSDASFLQASHRAVPQGKTKFQRMLSPSLSVHWKVYEQARNVCGFPLAHGHGVLFPRVLIEEFGGFDETTTSEDIDFSYKIALSRKFGRGHVSNNTWGSEEIPPSLQHYHIRFCRWLKQDLVLALRVLPRLVWGYLSLSEWSDVFVRQFHIPVCGLAFPYLLMLIIFLTLSKTSLNQTAFGVVPAGTHVPIITIGLILSLAPTFSILLLAQEGFLKRIWCAIGLIWLLNSLIVESGISLVELFTHSFQVKFISTGSLKRSQIKKKSISRILLYLVLTFLAGLSSCALLVSIMLAALAAVIDSFWLKWLVNCASAALIVIGFLQLLEHPVYILVLLPLGAFRY